MIAGVILRIVGIRAVYDFMSGGRNDTRRERLLAAGRCDESRMELLHYGVLRRHRLARDGDEPDTVSMCQEQSRRRQDSEEKTDQQPSRLSISCLHWPSRFLSSCRGRTSPASRDAMIASNRACRKSRARFIHNAAIHKAAQSHRRHQLASWKMTPSVCRRPEHTRLTPWRRLTQ